MLFPAGEFVKLKEQLILYECAMEAVSTRIDILLKDFLSFHAYNPVEHVKKRLKTAESIAEKLHRRGYDITVENAREHLTDIVGIRCICSYTKDINNFCEVLKRQPGLTLRGERDYITNPKPSGYRSYHLIFDMPVYLTDDTVVLPIEIQLRTSAMDFWASLEHKVRYKYGGKVPQHLAVELVDCAEKIASLDDRMYLIQEIIDMAYPHEDRAMLERTFSCR